MTLEQFLDRHDACEAGRGRAASFASLQDAWQNCSYADLLWAATRPGVLTDKELRLFAVFCARSVQHLMEDPRSVVAIDVAERHANGEATEGELRAAWLSAANANAYAARAARTAAPGTAPDRTACAAASARHSAADSADAFYPASVALSAAISAASASASDADAVAAREQQAAWLRQHTTPNFN